MHFDDLYQIYLCKAERLIVHPVLQHVHKFQDRVCSENRNSPMIRLSQAQWTYEGRTSFKSLVNSQSAGQRGSAALQYSTGR